MSLQNTTRTRNQLSTSLLRLPFTGLSNILKPIIGSPTRYKELSIMTTVTVSLSDEEMRRLEELSKREGLTVEQMVRLGINDFIGQPDDSFRAAARRVMENNAELYRRLS